MVSKVSMIDQIVKSVGQTRNQSCWLVAVFSERLRRNYKKAVDTSRQLLQQWTTTGSGNRTGKKRYVSISSWARPCSQHLLQPPPWCMTCMPICDNCIHACMHVRRVHLGSCYSLSSPSRELESNTCHLLQISSSLIAFSSVVILSYWWYRTFV